MPLHNKREKTAWTKLSEGPYKENPFLFWQCCLTYHHERLNPGDPIDLLRTENDTVSSEGAENACDTQTASAQRGSWTALVCVCDNAGPPQDGALGPHCCSLLYLQTL